MFSWLMNLEIKFPMSVKDLVRLEWKWDFTYKLFHRAYFKL